MKPSQVSDPSDVPVGNKINVNAMEHTQQTKEGLFFPVQESKLTIPFISASELNKTDWSTQKNFGDVNVVCLWSVCFWLHEGSNVNKKRTYVCHLVSGNTDIAQALDYAKIYVHDSAYGKRDYARSVVILITDGIATRNAQHTVQVKYFFRQFCMWLKVHSFIE